MTAGDAARTLARVRAAVSQRSAAADGLLALLVYLVVTFAVTSSAEVVHERGELIGAALNAAVVAPLAWRRRAPLAVLGTVGVAATVAALTFGLVGGESAVLIALATVAAREPRTGHVAAAALAVVAATVLVGLALGPLAVAEWLTVGLAVVAAVAVGVATRGRRALLADRAARARHERVQQAEIAVAAERTRIARELHDVIAHNVSVMVALADGAQHAFDAHPGQAREAMAHVAATGREALTELRGLLGLLRDEAGGEARRAPQPGLEQLDELVDRVRAAGLEARLCIEGEPGPLSPVAQVTVYRIVQEALTNVLRHARGARHVDVRLSWRHHAVAVEIVDDGHAESPVRAGGGGVAGMRERAAVHGAALSAGPRRDGGWRVATEVPRHPEAAVAG